jgi:hypothetical protein
MADNDLPTVPLKHRVAAWILNDRTVKIDPFIPKNPEFLIGPDAKEQAAFEREIKMTMMAHNLPLPDSNTHFFPAQPDKERPHWDPKNNKIIGIDKETAFKDMECATNGLVPVTLQLNQFYTASHEAGHHVTFRDPHILARMQKLATRLQSKLWTNEFMEIPADTFNYPHAPDGIKKSAQRDWWAHVTEVAADITAHIYGHNKYPNNANADRFYKSFEDLRGRRAVSDYAHDSSALLKMLRQMDREKSPYWPGPHINIHQAAELALTFMEKNADTLIDNYNAARTAHGVFEKRKTDPNAGLNAENTTQVDLTILKVQKKMREADISDIYYCMGAPKPPGMKPPAPPR